MSIIAGIILYLIASLALGMLIGRWLAKKW